MTQNELNKIIDLHLKWLKNEVGGKRANMYNADLRNADLYNADLRNANLSNADLRNAKSILSFIGEKHPLIYFKHGNTYYFKIGCMTFTIDHWLENFEEIGKKEGYSIGNIKLYGDVIKLFSQYELLGE